ncbi:MAG: hypothetical protein KF699_08390 [Phycisphaeraceae bacterium]|nr:hypothetical protein [Phycisphaeraceae bacterium]MBX3406178.1 hypothetical protein [Phycisphaeraceae bacterium]
MIKWKRTLRTASSERFIAVQDSDPSRPEVAAVDLHYLHDGTVSGTVVLLRGGGETWTEDRIPDLLASLDEEFLPDVDLARGNLLYTVVMGDVVGSYQAERDDDR